jgi:hypothetical protein
MGAGTPLKIRAQGDFASVLKADMLIWERGLSLFGSFLVTEDIK